MRILMIVAVLLVLCSGGWGADLEFAYTVGDVTPPSQSKTLGFLDTPDGTRFDVSAPNWLDVSPTFITVSSGVSYRFTFTLKTANLTPGVYNGTIDFSWSLGGRRVSASLFTVKATVFARPSITAGGIVDAASFRPGIVAGSWASVFGEALASTSPSGHAWEASDIVGGVLPTSLEGVSVLINGKPAALCFVSPRQLNLQVPDDETLGLVPIEVRTPQGTAQSSVELRRVAPALFARRYANTQKSYLSAASVHLDGALVGDPQDGKGARGASPGETVMLFGTGFGRTSPQRPAGRIIEPAQLAQPARVYIGDVPAEVLYGGVVSPGLYQLNVLIPQLPPRDYWVVVEVEGQQSQVGVALTIVQ